MILLTHGELSINLLWKKIRQGRRGFTILDKLHLENLKKIAPRFNLDNLSNEEYNFSSYSLA
jgi:hypothetical protein